LAAKAQQASLELTLQPNVRRAKSRIAWNVDLHHADFKGTFTFTSLREELVVLDFAVDPLLTVADVSGPDVQRWSVLEKHMQVWLRQPRKETTVEISGWRSVTFKGAPPAKQLASVPVVYPLDVQMVDSRLEVQPAPGLVVEPATLRGVRGLMMDPHHYVIEAAPYEASFNVKSVLPPPSAIVLTKVEGTHERMDVQHLVRLSTTRGRLPILKLRLKDVPNVPFALEAPGAIAVPLKSKQSSERAWTLNYPGGLPQEVFFSLRGHYLAHDLAEAALGTVELDGANIEKSWLAWKDVEIINPTTGKKPTSQKKIKDRIAAIANDYWSRDMGLWNGADAVRGLKASLTRSSAQSNLRTLAFNETARWLDGHWLHNASFWLLAQDATELRIQFAGPVVQFRAMSDRRSLPMWSASDREYLVPLDAGSLPRLIELRWKYASKDEPAETPNLGAARIAQVPLSSPQFLVNVPYGFTMAQPTGRSISTLFERLLNEAQTHLELSAAASADALPMEENLKEITRQQQRLYSCIREAEYALEVAKYAAPDFDSGAAAARVKNLKVANTNRAREHRYEDARKNAERGRSGAPPLASHDEWSGTGTPVLLAAAEPTMRLESAGIRLLAQHRAATEWVVLGAVFCLVMSYFRHGASLLRWFAPELAIALWGIGFAILGPSLIGAVAIGLLAIARLTWLGQTIFRKFAHAPSEQVTSTITTPNEDSNPPAP
jgi:hypothetical protein